MSELIFSKSPVIKISSNTFINVPIILKVDDFNLIEVIKDEKLGFTTQIPIYHPDGTYLAKVNGTRMYPTRDGEKAGLKIEKKADVWECKMEKQTLFEIQYQKGDQFKIEAELYSPMGYFVKCNDNPKPELVDFKGNQIQVGGITMSGNTISGCRIGLWLRSNGSFSMGVN